MPKRFMADLLEEHYEELDFLWGQRRAALRSSAYTWRELHQLEERIEAHVEGLLVAGEDLPEYLADKLGGDEADAVSAAAYPLLRLRRKEAALLVGDALAQAEG